MDIRAYSSLCGIEQGCDRIGICGEPVYSINKNKIAINYSESMRRKIISRAYRTHSYHNVFLLIFIDVGKQDFLDSSVTSMNKTGYEKGGLIRRRRGFIEPYTEAANRPRLEITLRHYNRFTGWEGEPEQEAVLCCGMNGCYEKQHKSN